MEEWLLTTEGIRDLQNQPVDSPFDSKLVHMGTTSSDQLALIVDRSEIWTWDGDWTKWLQSKDKLNCLQWTQDDRLLVGGEKGQLAWASQDGLEIVDDFDKVESRNKWTTPWGGPPDVRSLAEGIDGSIFANIHVGWIVRSEDGGQSWESCTQNLHKDVHQVNIHPKESGVVVAATAGGFHLSSDNGSSFEKRWDGFSQTYQRATAFFPDQEVCVVSVSNGPSGSNSRLYRSTDRGLQWEEVEGLPNNISTNINTYQLTLKENGRGYVIIEADSIFTTTDYGKSWHKEVGGMPKTYQIVTNPIN